jgi:anion-transporting  ArsA/GET3 family ATPase
MIADLIRNHRHIIIGGSGGVGKTSISAALGIASCQLGFNTLVLTIDPARRLAGALGIKEFPEEMVEITENLRDHGLELAGSLSVMMLKVEDAFRPLIERVIGDSSLRERVFSNPLYQEITRSLSGTPEYAALRRFAELSQRREYDRLILDTPPSTHALHFLTAPDRLHRFFQSGWVRLFIKISDRTGFRLLRRGGDLLISVMERLTGSHVVRTIGDFFTLTQDLFHPVEEEIKAGERVLRDPSTTFVVVTAPLPDELGETRQFLRSLRDLKIQAGGVIVNQLLPPFRASILSPETSAFESPDDTGNFIQELAVWLSQLKERTERERKISQETLGGEGLELFFIPKQKGDIHTLKGLKALADILLSPEVKGNLM